VATTVILVRHASHDRVGTILCGRMPGVTLGEEGRREAKALADRFRGETIAAVISSPLERARETAEIIADRIGMAVEIDEALNEIDFGAWTGQSFDALDPDPHWRLWNSSRSTARPPGGEAMSAAQARIVHRIERLRDEHPDGQVILVGHCDVLKSALAHHLGLSLDRYDRFEISPASVSVLALWPGGSRVMSVNEVVAA
jgi:probable phosphoglycerate mutase